MEDPDPDVDPDVPGPEAAEPKAPTVPKPPAPPKPPTPPAIVVDVPRIMEQAERAAKAQSAASPEAAPFIDYGFKVGRSAAEAGMKAAAEALGASRIDAAAAHEMQMQVEGRRVEIAVKKHGKLLGNANATLNLDRTLRTVLQLRPSRPGRDPVRDRSPRQALHARGVDKAAARSRLRAERHGAGSPRAAVRAAAATGSSSRAKRRQRTHLRHRARPIGASLREIRRASVRNLSLGLARHRARACRHRADLASHDAASVVARPPACSSWPAAIFSARVPVRSTDEFGALAAAFNQMAAGPRTPPGAGRRTGAAAPRARTVAADPDGDAAARRRCALARRRSTASRSRRAKSAATSSTTSSCRTDGWRCSSATSRARASAPRC